RPARARLGRDSTCFVRGKFDTVVKFDDGTYGVIDFKTSKTKSEHVSLYGRQLHAYAYSLENAAPGNFALRPISRLGLLVFDPNSFRNHPQSEVSLDGGLHWLEIPLDERSFIRFLAGVLEVLDQPSPPPPSRSCECCKYREASRKTGY
ncbi:MAG: PD-(D/E)XK nuclease family protein, partial [Nitrospinota bacterium]|nr:PD-(D/E)XK nuclease family protein [Nitrospinota bacterium]